MLKSVGCLESLSSFFNSMNNLSYSTDSYLPVMTVTLQAIRDEEMQYCEAYEARFGGVEVKTDKVKKEETKKKGTWYLTLQ